MTLFDQPQEPIEGVRDTSIAAHIEHKASGKLGAQEQRILEFLRIRQFGLTRNEIAHALNLRLSSVCGRVNTLIKAGVARDEPRRACTITGTNSHVVTAVIDPVVEAYKNEQLGTAN